MTKKTTRITMRDLLGHMQGMEQRMQAGFTSIDQRIDKLERHLTRQISGVDERVDAIENENLPRRVAVLEKIVLK